MFRTFVWIVLATLLAVARGETLEQTRQSVNLDEFQKLFAGESRMRKLIFRNYVLGPAVEAAFRDATAKP
jgi:hypothetical protein